MSNVYVMSETACDPDKGVERYATLLFVSLIPATAAAWEREVEIDDRARLAFER